MLSQVLVSDESLASGFQRSRDLLIPDSAVIARRTDFQSFPEKREEDAAQRLASLGNSAQDIRTFAVRLVVSASHQGRSADSSHVCSPSEGKEEYRLRPLANG